MEKRFTVLSGKDVTNVREERIDWLVEGLLPAIGTSIMGAAPKTGKSVLARQLAAFVRRGIPLLGGEVKQGATLYFSTQERPGPIAAHFHALGCSDENVPDLITEKGFDRKSSLQMLDEAISGKGYALAVIDMIVDFLPVKDTNDYEETRKVFAGLAQLAQKHRLHIAVTHHTKKVTPDNPVQAFIGSTAITGSVDQLLCMSVDKYQNRYLVTSQRYGESMPETELRWDKEQRAMYLGRSADELKTEQAAKTEERIEKGLVEFIQRSPRSTLEEILNSVTGDRTIKYRTFKVLKDTGQLLASGTGQKNDPFRYEFAN